MFSVQPKTALHKVGLMKPWDVLVCVSWVSFYSSSSPRARLLWHQNARTAHTANCRVHCLTDFVQNVYTTLLIPLYRDSIAGISPSLLRIRHLPVFRTDSIAAVRTEILFKGESPPFEYWISRRALIFEKSETRDAS